MNMAIIKGNICSEIDLKHVKEGSMAIAKFSVAVSRMKKDDPSDFFNCTAFGRSGELIAETLGKGKPILITGHLQTGHYMNKSDVKVYTTDVIVDRFEYTEKKDDNNSTQSDLKEADKDLEIPF